MGRSNEDTKTVRDMASELLSRPDDACKRWPSRTTVGVSSGVRRGETGG